MLAGLAVSRFRSGAPLQPAWLALVALGAAYRLHAGRFIPAHSNGLELSAASLALRGPYAWSRHPLYLSNLAVGGGLIGYAHCLPPIPAGALFTLACMHHDLLARREEKHLAAALGVPYLGYMQVTPRWPYPRRRPALGRGRSPVAGARRGSAPTGDSPVPSPVSLALSRQGGNLIKASAATAALWAMKALGAMAAMGGRP
jgi:hypothetical protein